jgi:hypothetical protein
VHAHSKSIRTTALKKEEVDNAVTTVLELQCDPDLVKSIALRPTAQTLLAAGVDRAAQLAASSDERAMARPHGLTVDANGTLWVSLVGHHRLRRYPLHAKETIAVDTGMAGPTALAADIHGDVYVADPIFNQINRLEVDKSNAFFVAVSN